MKIALSLIVLLLAALLYVNVNSHQEEAHRRQGELEFAKVKKICSYAQNGKFAISSVGNDKKYLDPMKPVQADLDSSCGKTTAHWIASYPDLAKEHELAGDSIYRPEGVMRDGHTLCIIGVDDGCH